MQSCNKDQYGGRIKKETSRKRGNVISAESSRAEASVYGGRSEEGDLQEEGFLLESDWNKVLDVTEIDNQSLLIKLVLHHILDGKAQTVKQIIESIDKVHKTVVYKVIEGNLLELYKTFLVKIHVDTKGENNLVTWTFEYEKLHEGIEDPTTTMDFLVKVTKEIETHHL
ncbi:hypothetical protein RJ640_013861 [Escallonia rubra]|uniref:Bet v I/Major latex protein domain-containing protein n=1 Tax=Escallonia rubra TaxID=112253 RepID=A0AA88RPM8_9ASTE|nr:hypothetical protein RJ640_013861 [Escallonia rubra]